MNCHCISDCQNQIFGLMRLKNQDCGKNNQIKNKLNKKFQKLSLKKIQSEKQIRANFFTINQKIMENRHQKSPQSGSKNQVITPWKQPDLKKSFCKPINFAHFSNKNIQKSQVSPENEEGKKCLERPTKNISFNYVNSKPCFTQLKIQNLKEWPENQKNREMHFSRTNCFDEELERMRGMYCRMGGLMENQNAIFAKCTESLLDASCEYQSSFESFVIDRSKRSTILFRLIQ